MHYEKEIESSNYNEKSRTNASYEIQRFLHRKKNILLMFNLPFRSTYLKLC